MFSCFPRLKSYWYQIAGKSLHECIDNQFPKKFLLEEFQDLFTATIDTLYFCVVEDSFIVLCGELNMMM